MKTDNRGLFEFSIMSFNNYGYTIDDISLDMYSDDITGNVQTEYEKKFVSKGNIIYRISVHK
jgi:tRNA (guanine-N7-)-methyltransferase